MATFLLELYSEEIPARMQQQAATRLADNLRTALKEAGLPVSEITTYHAPQRIALSIENMPTTLEASTTETRGPREGAPQQAIDGFCAGHGITADQLVLEETPKGRFYFYRSQSEAKDSAEILTEAVNGILRAFVWPKSMRWGSYETRWVRPLHRIVAMLDEAVLEGISFGHVQAGNATCGHRFLAPDVITLAHAKDYSSALLEKKVMVDAEARKTLILQAAKAFAESENLTLIEDEALLNEVAGLVEWPVVKLGQFDARFLELPEEVLISTIRTHQKYFCLRQKNGNLAPYFIITSNMETADDGAAIIAGNARVITARLSDAMFFETQDKKQSLDSFAAKLDGVVFHNKLGTIAEKTKRVKGLAQFLAVWVPGADLQLVGRAADIAKADLTTEMVGEFAELQGIMGRYYAIAQGEDNAVSEAILQHYAPKGEQDAVPSAPVSIALSLADKIDTLVGLFAAGEAPTGSKDPFGLRRAALGILRIIREHTLQLPLWVALQHAFKQYPSNLQKTGKASQAELQRFLRDRLSHMLKREGVRGDVIHAVIEVTSPEDILLQIAQKIEAVNGFMQEERGQNLAAAFKRAHNIVKSAKDMPKGKIQAKLLEEAAEKALYEALQAAQLQSAGALKQGQYETALEQLAQLREPIDAFFDTVTVQSEDEALRHNRLKLLHEYANTVKTIADFTLVE